MTTLAARRTVSLILLALLVASCITALSVAMVMMGGF